MPDTIPFELRLTLVPHLKDKKIQIDYQDQTVIVDKVDTEIVVNLNFDDLVDSIKILQVSGFEPDPDCNIEITDVSINGYAVKNFYDLMTFDMKDNPYVENESINQVAMLDFNGTLNLEIKKNIKRFRWFQFVFSKNRHGMIYKNDILGCTSQHGCWGKNGGCHHDDPWQLFDLDRFADKDHYDTVALGCSLTAGTGILKDQCWPSLLKSKGHEVLNLGLPGGGIDSIFINTINIIKSGTKFDQLIILLPNMTRQLVRVPKHGMTFNFFTNPQSREDLGNHFNIYFSKDELNALVEKHMKNLVMSDYVRRNKKLIYRLIHYLESTGVQFKISSWSDETYEILDSFVSPGNLLPKFNEGKDEATGIDGSHPSEKIHQKWVNDIISML